MNLKKKDYTDEQYLNEINRRRLTGKCINCLSDDLTNLSRIKRDNVLVHRGHCYRGFDQSHRERFNINNRSTYNANRVNNLKWFKRGKKGITKYKHLKHYKVIGISPINFYIWLNILSDKYGYDNRKIGTDKIPIDHFIPLRAENYDNYDKNKWYNLRPLTKLENKLRKSNLPEIPEIIEYMDYVADFRYKYL